MIVGLPGETDETVEETAKFIQNAKEVDVFGLHIFQPFPGCDIWRYPEKYKYFINKETDFKNFHTIGKPNTKLTDNNQVMQWYDYLKKIIAERDIAKQM